MFVKPTARSLGFRILIPFLALIIFSAPALGSIYQPKVLVLPFAVHAPQDMAYLSGQIATVLSEQLRSEGATLVKINPEDMAALPEEALDSAKARELAGRHAAERVIWGSFTLVDGGFNLQAHMAAPGDLQAVESFNEQGQNIENLINVIKKLNSKIEFKLFQRRTVSAVSIQGNERIEDDAILRIMQTKPGGLYKQKQLSDDLRSIYNMGYFDDLRVEAEPGTGGMVVSMHVKEKPTIRHIKLKGNYRFEDEEITDNMTLGTGAILNIFRIQSDIEQIESMYREKNYHQVRIEYKVLPTKKNQADIEFTIQEGKKLYVTSILFEGNKAVGDKELKKVMQTSEKGFFYWLTSSGNMDRSALDQDADLIKSHYLNQGYTRARVADPVVDIGGESIQITFRIEEGPRYKVGKVEISGDLILDSQLLMQQMTLNRQEYFNREKLRDDILALKDIYGSHGFAYANITPRVKEDNQNLVVDITYVIDKHQEVYFENIFITGNRRTRDKVIRRQLLVKEQERFNTKLLKRSIRNLYRIDYFEDTKVDTLKGSADDKMILKIDVTEKPTGQFSFGAGYSSAENFFFTGSITEHNMFGRGQRLSFSGQFGSSTTRYSLKFTEPWLFDMPLSGTLTAYQLTKTYSDSYDRESFGGGWGLSYPIFDYTRLYWNYAYDSSEVYDVSDDADDTIKEMEGVNVTSSSTIALGYDTRDHVLAPTEGVKHRLNVEYAGIGGDVGFEKYIAETGWYFPLFKGFVWAMHAKAGIVHKNAADKLLPDYKKFYLGGMYSLRGFDYRGVHIDSVNSEGTATEIGGHAMAQFNFELLIPLSAKIGFMGVVFYDTGNVYEDTIDLGDLRRSAGYGIRWFSPVAPIRLEYGKILDPREGDGDGGWEFTLGGAF